MAELRRHLSSEEQPLNCNVETDSEAPILNESWLHFNSKSYTLQKARVEEI